MNGENLINLNTKIHFSKLILFSIFNENNFKLSNQKDKIEIHNLKRIFDNILIGGILISSLSYFCFDRLILSNSKLSFIFNKRVKIMKSCIDFIFISGISFAIGIIHNRYLNDKILLRLKKLQKNNRYLIKNCIVADTSNINDDNINTGNLIRRLHKYDYSKVYFINLLFVRLLI
jgi:hypothetical protein